jgi:L-histidine Nalpha-methyltransferase
MDRRSTGAARRRPPVAAGELASLAVHVTPADLAAELRADARIGLGGSPKTLPPRWFYDDEGSRLFDEITRLPEYYPTRRERAILGRRAGEIAARASADTLIELGSGTSEKTRLLLDAMAARGALRRFVPFDVCEPALREAGAAIAGEYPGLEVHAIAGDFERHLGHLPRDGRRLVAFLGGTIGNLLPGPRRAFLREIAAGLAPGDAFLVGTDLVKDPSRLVAAYDDAAGVTAAFNRNVLRVLNRELDADFAPERFDHVARWDPAEEWIEMRLRARGEEVVRVGALDLEVRFAAGEELRTETSAKFRRASFEAEVRAAGLAPAGWWTDPDRDFALSLWTR